MSDDATPPEQGAEGAPPPPAKKSKAGLVLVGVLLGGLGAGFAVGMFTVGPVVAQSSGYVVTEEMQARLKATAKLVHGEEGEEGEGATDEAGSEGEEGGGEEGGHEPAASGEHKEGEAAAGGGNLHLIDNLVMNPAGSGGTRFLMLSTAIEFKDAAMVEQFKARDAEVRDLVLRVMGAKTVEQLSDMAVREVIRKEVADSLAMLVPKKTRKKAITRIFFPQFVIQ
ncbi:MAG: flagellar basal body-associated FliL family protein [Gemmatimonadetes bacterium]|nr:flagellar basal body-associated FliL family protein [Gemmatimonadota bacterium]